MLIKAYKKLTGSFYKRFSTTHFGYKTIQEDEKKPLVADVFHKVADKYDLMNDLMSFGIHRFWKDYFVQKLNPISNTYGNKKLHILDVAGGTGDIAFRIAKKLNENDNGTYVRTTIKESNEMNEDYDIIVCDINDAMLKVGKERYVSKGLDNGIYPSIGWVQGDAEALKFKSDTFDVYTIAFGIRNVTHIQKVLDEAYRVLNKGGRFMCLEFSSVDSVILRRLYDMYSFNIIPAMGEMISNDRASYQYLVESIRQFPDQNTFKEMIENSGFKCVSYENLSLGIVSIHSGFKL